ncbi:hypothetical protein QMK19_29040 [Streptomyces sp. H10-C2]|uniref:hypothetical protein n=1 Tax=Streptomyces TaxID=1883 RepID=UPI0018E05746|nr:MULTISPECIES: hypothetical protein [Streptomyces]MDJ0344257.1 hypothetical protein [Streptomyces sp. PH10-H1]MDJ0373595.1 hypothetical protein [Streptomyces sp. H10-C2]
MPGTPQDNDPTRLIPPAEFARLLGHKDTTTLSHWLTKPPDGFPEPDSWDELPTRRRPMWRLDRAQAYATTTRPDPERRRSRGGRGGAPGLAPRPDRDPRAAEVAQWIADADAGRRPQVTRQDIEQAYAVPDYTARRILTRARTRGNQDQSETETGR